MLMSERKPSNAHWGKPRSDREILTEAITKKLKSYYDDIAERDIPDHFRDLLDKLDASEAVRKLDKSNT
jgi:hypothetical protein